jgi:hypothetical protein
MVTGQIRIQQKVADPSGKLRHELFSLGQTFFFLVTYFSTLCTFEVSSFGKFSLFIKFFLIVPFLFLFC